MLAKRLGSKAPINPVAGLTPDDSAGLIVKKLRNVHRPIAVIGHEPHLGALASLLVTGKAKPSRFVLKKCAALRLDRIDGAWMVRWHVSPALV